MSTSQKFLTAKTLRRQKKLSINNMSWFLLCLGVLVVTCSFWPSAVCADFVYAQVKPNYHWQFPTDHGAHPKYKTEWWYYVGHLKDTQGKRYGFELAFFRVGLDRGAENPSAFTPRDIYFSHFAISDIGARKFWYAEKMNRSGPGLAGASQGRMNLWNENWQIWRDGPGHHLKADDGIYGLDLIVQSPIPAILEGIRGYSKKGFNGENASLYYSFPSFIASGRLRVGSDFKTVHGNAWMDHEFFSGDMDPYETGWDWFGLQLSDNTELMIYLMRQKDGSFNPASSGTFINKLGKSVHLASGTFRTTVLETWKSPRTGAVYPIHWQIAVPSRGLVLDVIASIPDQELDTAKSTQVVYWEGSVDINGTKAGKAIKGEGYMELTGYDKPFNLFNLKP
jgi:predicted secreted hydrolase